jgi:CRISPR/Cas system CSM-associated protein Csm3 (group 7 of RAMP superfamily)
MKTYRIHIRLLSDATFGRGDGVAGLIDQEVEHDQYGFPYLRGRTLKGVLSEECDNLIAALPLADTDEVSAWNNTLARLFGAAGSTEETAALWTFGDAQLPGDVRQSIAACLRKEQKKRQPALTPTHVLESLTTVRRQTAIDAERGAAEDHSLRSMRVICRNVTFSSLVCCADSADITDDLMLLAAGCLALRHIGLGRNRGRGQVQCSLHDEHGDDITERYFQKFAARISA